MPRRQDGSYPLKNYEGWLHDKGFSQATVIKYLQAVRSILKSAEDDPSLVTDSVKLKESVSSSLTMAAWNNYVEFSRSTDSRIPLAMIGKRATVESRRLDVSPLYAHAVKLLLQELTTKNVPQFNIIQTIISDYKDGVLSFPCSKIPPVRLDKPFLMGYIVGNRNEDEPLVAIDSKPATWDEWCKIVNQADALPLSRQEYLLLYSEQSDTVSVGPCPSPNSQSKPAAPRSRPPIPKL